MSLCLEPPDDVHPAHAQVVRLFEYSPTGPTEADGFDKLADMISTLPSGLQVRVITEISKGRKLLCHLLVVGQVDARLLSASGLGFRLITDQPQRVMDRATRMCHAPSQCQIVKIKGGAAITYPGMTQQFNQWLIRENLDALVVFDFSLSRTPGLANFNLTFVLQAKSQAAPFVNQVSEIFFADPVVCSDRYTTDFLRRLSRGEMWKRPRLPACTGNVADLFPFW